MPIELTIVIYRMHLSAGIFKYVLSPHTQTNMHTICTTTATTTTMERRQQCLLLLLLLVFSFCFYFAFRYETFYTHTQHTHTHTTTNRLLLTHPTPPHHVSTA